MYMTQRERAMELAQNQGYKAYPYGVMPSIYFGDKAKYLADVWKAGFEQAKREREWR